MVYKYDSYFKKIQMNLIRRHLTLDPRLVYSPLDPNHVQACLNGPRYSRQIIIIDPDIVDEGTSLSSFIQMREPVQSTIEFLMNNNIILQWLLF